MTTEQMMRDVLEALNSFPVRHLTPKIAATRSALRAHLSHPASAANGAEGGGEVVSGVVHCWAVTGLSMMFTGPFAQTDAQEEARRLGGTSKAFRLYATSPASQPQALVPLTKQQIADLARDEELLLLCDGMDSFEDIVRAVERAHGINGLEVKP